MPLPPQQSKISTKSLTGPGLLNTNLVYVIFANLSTCGPHIFLPMLDLFAMGRFVLNIFSPSKYTPVLKLNCANVLKKALQHDSLLTRRLAKMYVDVDFTILLEYTKTSLLLETRRYIRKIPLTNFVN